MAKVWDVATGRLRAELQGRVPGIFPLTLSPDDKHLAAASSSVGSLWTMEDGRMWPLEGKSPSGDGPAFSADGSYSSRRDSPGWIAAFPIYSAHATTSPRRPRDFLSWGPAQVIVSPNARRYSVVGAASGSRTRSVVIHGLPDRQEIRRFDVSGLVHTNFSPDGRHFALLVYLPATDPKIRTARLALGLRILVTDTGREDLAITFPTPILPDPGWKFSPDGKSLAVWYNRGDSLVINDENPSDRPHTVEIWDLPAP